MTKRQYLQVCSHNRARALTLLVVVAYACCYVGRLNYPAAMVDLLSLGLLTKGQGGIIATSFFACYGIGQLINGYVSDRTDAVRQVALGLFGSAVMNLLMSMTRSFLSMFLIWSLNGYMQSLIWAPAFLVVSQSVPLKWRKHSLMYLNMAPPAGTVLSFLISGIILRQSNWKHTFTGGCIVLLITGVLWLVLTSVLYRGATEFNPTEKQHMEGGTKGRITIPYALVISGAVFMIIPTILHGMLRDGITNWLPTYLSEVFSLRAETAVISSVAVPLINSMGTVGAYAIFKKMKNEFVTTSTLFAISAGMLLILILVGDGSILITILSFALVTACMMGVNTMICSEIASRFAIYGRAGGVSGFFDASGYVGTAVSMYLIAFISDRYGWDTTQFIWLGASLIAMTLCALGLSKWKSFLADSSPKHSKTFPV